MQRLKFLSLLKKLTKQELEDFHRYLKRYHRREKIALRVFEYLIRFYPDFEHKEKLGLEYAYQKIFKTDLANSGWEINIGRSKPTDSSGIRNTPLAGFFRKPISLSPTLTIRTMQTSAVSPEISKKQNK